MSAAEHTATPDDASPLISVVVPAWNADATLAKTLRSVAAQSHRNLEIVIVDDGSTDKTWAIANDFCAAEVRARVIRTKNCGPSAARNRGIAESKGEWIAPIDADDIWHPTKIEKQLAAAASADERPGFVYCWFRRIDADDVIIASGPRVSLSGSVFVELCYFNPVGNGSALLISREAIEKVGGYDETLWFCEDHSLQLRIARLFPVIHVPEHLVGWRHHGRNASIDAKLIAQSCNLIYHRISNEGVRIPPQVVRWVKADGHFYTAEQEALRHNRILAMWHLVVAIVLDPIRCGGLATYRGLRSIYRRLTTQLRPAERVAFLDVSPSERLLVDLYEITSIRRWLDRIDAIRLVRLRREERHLP